MRASPWTIEPCDRAAIRAIADDLGVTEITASVLVRRGYTSGAEARAFLESDGPSHDPLLLGDMGRAVERIREAVDAGTTICVHGDYDVDGICSTALAVLTLRELGADARWHLPSRLEDGYGLSLTTVERLAAEGVGLLLTVDCGITAVEEVAAAIRLGLDVIVTDHHRPGASLPDCPVVATRPSAYPFPELCGTGVVYKLAQALLGADHPAVARHLDLVALATIADVVPLVDENRMLATAGLRTLARTQKVGLRALMRSAHVDPAAIDSSSVGFRLGPRLNAAGRLSRPDLALALVLSEDADEAADLAQQLEALNRDRQAVEEAILRDAVALVESWPAARRERRGYVLAGESWHEGVIGIVASRLVERFGRPVVMIAGGGELWKGSGRTSGTFDLHGALAACADDLERFGGHRAAAGLAIRPDRIEAFAEAFGRHADSVLDDDQLVRPTVVDAIVPASALTLDLAHELERLAPFGLANPDVTLLVPSCELIDPGAVGEGRHLRFRVRQHGRDAGSAIAFGQGSELGSLHGEARYDVVCRLKENRWNGMVSPQLVVGDLVATHEGYESLRSWLGELWKAGEASWTPAARAVFSELDLGTGAGKRQLLESAAFRALLEQAEALPRAA